MSKLTKKIRKLVMRIFFFAGVNISINRRKQHNKRASKRNYGLLISPPYSPSLPFLVIPHAFLSLLLKHQNMSDRISSKYLLEQYYCLPLSSQCLFDICVHLFIIILFVLLCIRLHLVTCIYICVYFVKVNYVLFH